MTPKEKAKDLFDKMLNECGIHSEAVECAMIAVDEIIEALYYPVKINLKERIIIIQYWQSVEEELKKM